MYSVWIKALEKAAAGKCGGPVNVNFDEFYETLGLDKSAPYTSSTLNRAYRKAALKNHPDKGGDVDSVSLYSDVVLYCEGVLMVLYACLYVCLCIPSNVPLPSFLREQFKKVQEAFEILQNKLEEEEQAKLHEDVYYTACITKGPAGVGFGMVVVEDSKKGAIIAKVPPPLPRYLLCTLFAPPPPSCLHHVYHITCSSPPSHPVCNWSRISCQL